MEFFLLLLWGEGVVNASIMNTMPPIISPHRTLNIPSGNFHTSHVTSDVAAVIIAPYVATLPGLFHSVAPISG